MQASAAYTIGGHMPVMLAEVLEVLQPRDGAIYLDGTFGRGGYARAILQAADCNVVGLDRDPAAIQEGERIRAEFPGRLQLIEGCFGDMDRLLPESPVDGIALDLGVSSPQLDEAERGFSFRADGPLDMRMGGDGPTAADVVNESSEPELSDIIWRLGEERRARAVARAIVAARSEAPVTTTFRLAEIVRSVVKPSADGIDPATRTFQAFRLHVNDELGELERGLSAAERILAPGGRLAVVSFHSLEDRIVKRFLRAHSDAAPQGSRHAPARHRPDPCFTLLSRNAIRPTREETARNPRSRSARLRAAERTRAPALEVQP
ncbi:16S rRNA (cytosine(1402)-N(4))-methyltransferase RsmH [Fodinicurvata fenggangensis]|uniref:16S rRNA (cytosine(1402)-N(4))-methyltransferase RsmH n=1 Tax=Fodinicurvata fenggangensis TaxID=1121830 RepID=UPI0004794277|nr:16S rRNA (cytosine(1402)-N(4))-methyltransferase RsmH [Fodinicurvata fenggangensis]